MTQLFQVLTLVLVFATSAQCSVVRRDLPPLENYTAPFFDCFTPYDRCYLNLQTEVYEELDHFESLRSFMGNRQLLEQLATDANTMVTCFRNVSAENPECEHHHYEDIVMYRFISSYLGTQEGLDRVVALSTTPCLVEEPPLNQLYAVVMNCIGMAGQNPYVPRHEITSSDKCYPFSSLQRCLSDGASFVCGRVAGEFVDSVMDFAASSEAGMQAAHVVFGNVNFCPTGVASPKARRSASKAWSLAEKLGGSDFQSS